jgi:hypothetical protein
MSRICKLCTSSYRKEVEKDLDSIRGKKWGKVDKIAKKYASLFGTTSIHFRQMIYRHLKHIVLPKEQKKREIMEKKEIKETLGSPNLNKFADRLMEVGMGIINKHPEKVSLSHVINSQRLLLEKAKVQTAKDALQMNMAKFFRGLGGVIEGEEVEDGGGTVKQLGASSEQSNTD